MRNETLCFVIITVISIVVTNLWGQIPFGAVRGNILSQEGLPISDIEVRLLEGPEQRGRWNTVHTNAKGIFIFDNVLPGEYTTIVVAPPSPYLVKRSEEHMIVRSGEMTNIGVLTLRTTKSIYVNSVPERARIDLDRIDINLHTPATVPAVTRGRHALALKLEGYEQADSAFNIDGTEGDTIVIVLKKATGWLEVKCNQQSAEIRIGEVDGEIIGRTSGSGVPYTLPKLYQLPAGETRIFATKEDFMPDSAYAQITMDTTSVELNLVERPRVGQVNFRGSPKGAHVYVNDEYLGQLPIDGAQLKEGSYAYSAKAKGYDTVKGIFRVQKNQSQDLQVILRERSRFAATWRSILIPGWGQFHTSRKTEGTLALISNLGAIGMFTYSSVDHNRNMDDFEKAKRQLELARYSQTPADTYRTLQDRYKSSLAEANSSADFRNVALAVLIGAWISNVLDANLLSPSHRTEDDRDPVFSNTSFQIHSEILNDSVILGFGLRF